MALVAQDEDSPQSPTLDKLLTADQSILLDTIDKLRNHGVNKYIKLPQIIVCGDQSSGKSSVLEAISHISFPRGKEICTTFPTELSLRRGVNRSVKVKLKPSVSRPENERILLASYQPLAGQLEDFEPLVTHAKEHLRQNPGTNRKADSFFEDILHVEVTDPNWPPLSLVDLPGLISSPNPQQTSEDVDVVNKMVSKYMENPKSIILAVISASYELPVQKVFSMIQKYDPQGKRTICVLTKPDKAAPGANDLPQFVQYAQNKLPGYSFELGWHVVMNRGHDSEWQTLDERDDAERDFFAQSSWSGKLLRDQLGIDKLRDRLSTLLERHTRAEMPGVLKQIRETLDASRDELSRLGPARFKSEEQKTYLTTISQRFENLVRQAINGHYDDPSFFLPELPESDSRKLRAAVQNLNEDFAKRMHEKGHAKRIVNEVIEVINKTSSSPEVVLRSEYIQHIKALSRKNRGMELIGSPNLRLVRDLFIEQSHPWRVLAREHLETVVEVVIDLLATVSDNVASPETAAALRREVVYDAMDSRRKRVLEKLEELLKPYEKGHPITYNLAYIENSRKLVKADVKARLESYQRQIVQDANNNRAFGAAPQIPQGLQIHQVMDALKLDAEDIEEVDCMDIFNSMQAYYEGALCTFIDNVAVLAVESCLIDGLDKIFSAIEVINMDDQKLSAIAAESEQAQAERLELEHKVNALQDAQRECIRAGVIHKRQNYEPHVTTLNRESSPYLLSKPPPTASPASSQETNVKTAGSGTVFGASKGASKSAANLVSTFSKAPNLQATGSFGAFAPTIPTTQTTPGFFREPVLTVPPVRSAGLFGEPISTSTQARPGGIFGRPTSTSSTHTGTPGGSTRGGLFNFPPPANADPFGGFRFPTATSPSSNTNLSDTFGKSLFENPPPSTSASSGAGLFANSASEKPSNTSAFGNTPSANTSSLGFGSFATSSSDKPPTTSTGVNPPPKSTGTSAFGSSFGRNHDSGNTPISIKPIIWSNIQIGDGGFGAPPDSLNHYQVLPMYLSDFMSFEELHLLEMGFFRGERGVQVRDKLNENRLAEDKFTLLEGARLTRLS